MMKFLTEWHGLSEEEDRTGLAGIATFSNNGVIILEVKLPSFKVAHAISLAFECIESQARYAGRQEMKAAITNTMKNL